ncbi:MAG: pyridoxal-phosphate dependent enzyme, partial [Acidimicrobiia bacterium]|nr:pyridoxal-phosphate dependent enzyme [Acidimicrobiia bacterium]
MNPDLPIDAADIEAAAARIAPYVHRTPLVTSAALSELAGCDLWMKAENLQKVGAFKARGAHNAVFALSEAEAAAGVVTHSSGNH